MEAAERRNDTTKGRDRTWETHARTPNLHLPPRVYQTGASAELGDTSSGLGHAMPSRPIAERRVPMAQ